MDLYKLINLCRYADTNVKLSNEMIEFIVVQIISDYPIRTFKWIKNIIIDGIKGKYDAENYQQPINSRTIFGWIAKDAIQTRETTRRQFYDEHPQELQRVGEKFEDIPESTWRGISQREKIKLI